MKTDMRYNIYAFSQAILISILVLFGLLNFIAKSYAQRQPACCEFVLKDGFYVGAGVGYDRYRIRERISIPIIANPVQQYSGVMGNFFGGYGQYYQWFYIAGEVFINVSDAGSNSHIHHAALLDTQLINLRETYGFSMLPGVRFNDFALLYARVGYSRTLFKFEESGTGPIGSFDNANTAFSNAIHYGIGIETVVYDHIDLRADYIYTSYGAFISPLGTRYAPSNSQFILGIIYHFA